MRKLGKETSVVRSIVIPLISEYLEKDGMRGIDVGFGGDKIVESFDGCDLPRPYGKYEGYKVDIPCDVSKGIPVADSTYDVVYSSHLIEDFSNTALILMEFVRICKPEGKIVLVFPDQKKYVKRCIADGSNPNKNHKIENMGIDYMENQVRMLDIFSGEIFKTEIFPYNCVLAFRVKR